VTEQLALEVIDLVYLAARSFADEARRAVDGGVDLEMSEFVLLRAIDNGTTSPSGLARELHVHPASISRSVTRLVRAGLLERRTSRQDSRRTELMLTPAGRAAVSAIAERVRPFVQTRLAGRSPADIAAALTTLASFAAGREQSP
jgi:DNA-binding MarR family transcriptional regulator